MNVFFIELSCIRSWSVVSWVQKCQQLFLSCETSMEALCYCQLIPGFGRCYGLSVKCPGQAHVLECWSPVGDIALNHFGPLWMKTWCVGTGSKG